ncbi:sugar diacid recognition domain-containing protein [Eubacterium sp. 1001713B170207_170306_E7]|uniref:CdaR family transcriptional regulator n=1 Tax=Eubacterium sp. 1001713B170207_170306_E7 TaxID=2787097 RepID=UPI001897760F|nr:sugar diacid recognition domain-containing protein [Eubacterium sp. 1001713B170207_170306_E7]
MLDSKTAQKIADEVMNSLGYNINVMNKNAIIIGSGIVERIGTFHETAMQTIRDCAIYEVTEEDAARLQGVKAGINMPIVSKDGRVLGAVGITGKPDEVRNIGKLVKMTAELIIEQEESMNQFYRHRNDKELFVTMLLSDSPGMSSEEMKRWGQRMGYDMELPRAACIISRKAKPNTGGYERLLDRIKRSKSHSKQDLSVVMSAGYILVFKHLDRTEPWRIEQTLSDYQEHILGNLDKEDQETVQFFIGGYHKGINGYRKSYEDAAAMYRSVSLPRDTALFFSHRHLLEIFYAQMDAESRERILAPYIKLLEEAFGKGAMDAVLTMKGLLENGFRYEQTANEMFLHKNTVIFRKKKVDQCLGIDPKGNMNDLVLMRLIICQYLEQTEE